ncbi:MAG: sterol desaturase family protein, partial [Deltaproteobacteria bacterium]|nr:sterol desaturase family protein [Deltaproteobacteria bacterium]
MDLPDLGVAVTALGCAVAAALGFFAWGFVEYLVHGILGHRYRTFVTPLHGGHHIEPRAVFTSPLGWVPIAGLLWAVAALTAGPLFGSCFFAALLAGFLRYEYVHWRIHFRTPKTPRQRLLHQHHLAHHFVNAKAYHGVTTRLWDRVFGTLPETRAADYARVCSVAPLAGGSNLAAIWHPRTMLGP